MYNILLRSAIFAVTDVPTPPDRLLYIELGRSSALDPRTNEVDSPHRAISKFKIFATWTLRMLMEFFFLYNTNLKNFATYYNERAAHSSTVQSPVLPQAFNAYLNSSYANVLLPLA
jgi:hypothetical protein